MTATPAPVHGHVPHRVAMLVVATLAIAAVALVVIAQQDRGGGGGSSTTRGSGVPATETRPLPAFGSVELAGANRVTVQVGQQQSVVVRADDNLLERVTTEVRGGELIVDTTGSFTTETPMSVDVTVPSLTAVTLAGSGAVDVEGVDATQFTVAVPGSGTLTGSGTATRLDVSLAGSADVRLQGLAARDVTATLSGSGTLEVQATGTLDANVSGSGLIFYSGSPAKVSDNVTGSGAVIEG